MVFSEKTYRAVVSMLSWQAVIIIAAVRHAKSNL